MNKINIFNNNILKPELFPKYGEVWLLKNTEKIKEISKDYRPVLVISSNERNKNDNYIVVLPFTTEDLIDILPVEVLVNNTKEIGLDETSKILCDSPFTFTKSFRFHKKLGKITPKIMEQVKSAWNIAFNWE